MTQDDLEIEQYRSLRAEIIRAMEDGNQVMTFGLGAIGIVMTAGIGAKGTPISFFIFAVIVPSFSSMVMSMWFAAQERIARASFFITGIESRLKESLNASIPLWDSWLRTSPGKKKGSSQHFWNTEFSGIAIFAFLIFCPLLLSGTVSGVSVSSHVRILVEVTAGVAYAILFAWFRVRVRRWRNWLGRCFGEL